MTEPRERPATPLPSSDALRESAEHFRQLVAGVADYAIFLLDEQGTIRSWNVGADPNYRGFAAMREAPA